MIKMILLAVLGLLTACGSRAPNELQMAMNEYKACLKAATAVEQCERQRAVFNLQRDQAFIGQGDAALYQQQLLNAQRYIQSTQPRNVYVYRAW